MALRTIVTEGDNVLHKHCRPVTSFDGRLHELIDDMRETLLEADGVGLAAPQVGVLRRVVLVLETNVPEGGEPYIIELVNPEIIACEGGQTGPEGCLSVKGKQGTVTRPEKVKLVYRDRQGRKHKLTAEGFFARAVCHELDHLDGVIYTDKATDVVDVKEEER